MLKFFDKRIFILLIFPLFLGAITVFTFQPYNFFFINFISLSFLFLLIIHVKKRSKSIYRKKPFLKRAFILGTSYGFGFFLFGIYWISNSLTFDPSLKLLIPLSLIVIPLFLSLFFSVPIMFLSSILSKNFSSIILISLVFAISDFLRGNILSGFPWNLWGYSFSWSTESLQILSTVGFYTFNLFAITIFFIPSIVFYKKNYKFFILLFFVAVAFSNFFYGSYIINSKKYPENLKKINFKIISGGFDLKDFRDEKKIVNDLIKYSEPKKDKKTIFIWPEGTFVNDKFLTNNDIRLLFKNNFSENHLIVFGANTVKEKKNTKNFFNSMIVVNKDMDILAQYDKKKLVPFGEFLPMEKVLKSIGLKTIASGYSSFSKGQGKSVLKIEFDKYNLNFLSLICYEIIFPNLVENHDNQFNLILNISEDAWFGKSIGPQQHFAKAIFRAIESGSYVLRSANKGTSAFINSNGVILKSLKSNEVGNIELSIPIYENIDYKPKKSLIFILVLITYAVIFFILRKLKL